jgi:hypothetical protein
MAAWRRGDALMGGTNTAEGVGLGYKRSVVAAEHGDEEIDGEYAG